MWCILLFMKTKKTPHKTVSNGEVLNFSVDVMGDMLSLKSASNVLYSDRTIIYHLFMLLFLKLVLVILVIFVMMLPQKELLDIDLEILN